MMLIVAILELYLKQQVLDQNQQNSGKSPMTPSRDAVETTPPPENKKISTPYQFFQTIGVKLKHYWKIGIHWLSKLRALLHMQFDEHVIHILASG